LSTGAKAGIGVGVALLALILLGICIFAIFSRRKKRKQAAEISEMAVAPPPYLTAHPNLDQFGNPLPVASAYDGYHRQELGSGRRHFSELPGIEVFRGHELDAK
jgi:hypothetical protein